MQLRNRAHPVLHRQLLRRLLHAVHMLLIIPFPLPMSSQLRGRCRVQVAAVPVRVLAPKVARGVVTRVGVLVVRADALPTTAVTAVVARTVVRAVSPPLLPCHAILVLPLSLIHI